MLWLEKVYNGLFFRWTNQLCEIIKKDALKNAPNLTKINDKIEQVVKRNDKIEIDRERILRQYVKVRCQN